MDDWRPGALAKIAYRLGLAFTDLTPPRSCRFRAHDALSIHALDWGGEGPAVVLLHGGSLSARTWDYVALALRADFRLVALDLRGHGASDWADAYPIEDYAADVLTVADGLGIERARLVGMSLGGTVACEFALRHADRTESLTMIDVTSRPVFAATARMRSFMGHFRGAATVEEVAALALAVSPKSDPERLLYRMQNLLRRGEDGRFVWKRDHRRPADYPMILAHLAGFEARVGAITAPFLLARGGQSPIVTEDAARDFTARFPDGRWIEIEGAGHNVQEDNPRDLAQALRVFWTERPQSRGLVCPLRS
jgi:pimeloyl-ACP methyl ester carboxylesterase